MLEGGLVEGVVLGAGTLAAARVAKARAKTTLNCILFSLLFGTLNECWGLFD